MMLNKRRDLENGMRAPLRAAELKLGTPSFKDFLPRVRELATDDWTERGLADRRRQRRAA